MIGQWLKLSLYNGVASSGTYTVKALFWRVGSSGIEYDSTERTLMNAVSIGANSWADGTAFDNSSAGWMGADLTITSATSIAHSLVVHIKRSTDGGATYPANGVPVDVINQGSAGALSAGSVLHC